MWSLVAVDGVGVPATIGPDLTIVDGDLQILVDHTFSKRTRAIIAGAAFQGWQNGRWTIDGGRLELSVNGGTESALAVWTTESLELRGARTLRYSRAQLSLRTPRTLLAP